MKHFQAKTCLTALLLSSSVAANAALVNFELTGDVQAAIGNPYGLTDSDFITVNGIFDDSVLAGGSGVISFDDAINNFSITVGNTVFTDDMVVSSASLSLNTGNFVGLSYTTTNFGGFQSIVSTFTGNSSTLAGSWLPGSFTMTPVPVPAAVWLFGSGLLGLVGVARRKQ